jgi:site-specific DNA-methyltransferase (adenine-specific)
MVFESQPQVVDESVTTGPDVNNFTTAKIDGRITIVTKEQTGGQSSESPQLPSTQLSLLDVSGAEKIGSATIQWLPVDQLFPHPDNPRLIYREDIIDTIAQSIADGGFKPEYALLVRPFEDGYQIISGHTRHKAALQANCQMLPCWVKEMGDVAAFMELVLANNQGELSPLEYGIHVLKYVELSEGGRGKKGGLSEYARMVGKAKSTLSECHSAAKLLSRIKCSDIRMLLNKSSHLAEILKAPEQYGQQLTELLIEKEWSVKQTETIVSAIKEVDIPQVLHGFLNPEYWVKKVIADATSDNPQNLQHSIGLWVKSAMEGLEALPKEEMVWQFNEDDLPYCEPVNLSAKFLEKLPSLIDGDKVPSQKKIDKIRAEISNWAMGCNAKYERWNKAKASKEEQERQRQEELARLNALRVEYAPTGINADILTLSLKDFGNELLDAIITDPPYLISNGGFTLRDGKRASVDKNFEDTEGEAISPEEWIPHVAEWLHPGGVIVATCTLHIYHRMVLAAKEAGLLTEELQSIWHKPNAAPQLSPTTLQTNFEYIFVAFKPGEKSLTQGIEDYQRIYGEYPSRIFTIPQCGGTERVGWHDTQKPLELYEKLITLFVPFGGRVLDPFAGSGTTAVAAKRLQRVAYWVEKSEEFYPKTEQRIESEKFAWEA